MPSGPVMTAAMAASLGSDSSTISPARQAAAGEAAATAPTASARPGSRSKPWTSWPASDQAGGHPAAHVPEPDEPDAHQLATAGNPPAL